MKFPTPLRVIYGMCLCVVCVCHSCLAEPVIIGEAHSIDGKNLLYTELHYRAGDNQWRVQYVSPDGNPVAEKTLHYQANPQQPNFELINWWSQQQSSARRVHSESPGSSYISVGFGELPESKPQENKLIDAKNVVVDAGFDNFVRQQWTALLNGETVSYDFLVPSRLATLALQTQRVECDESLLPGMPKKTQDQREQLVCMRTVTRNIVLRLAVPAIHLVYEANSKRLLRFVGLSNIADRNRKMLEVDIRYRYIE